MNRAERDAAPPVANELGAAILPPARVPGEVHAAMVGGVMDPEDWHVPHLVMALEVAMPSSAVPGEDARRPAEVHVLRAHVLGRDDEPAATAVVASHPEWRLPELVAAPEGIMDRLGQLFGGADVDFEGDSDFSDAFKVSGESERRIRTLLRAEVRRRLVQLHPIDVEVRRESILVLRREPLPLDQVPDLTAQVVGLMRELVE